MKKASKLISLMASLLLCATFICCSNNSGVKQEAFTGKIQAGDYTTYQSYWFENLGYDVMPIGAWVIPPAYNPMDNNNNYVTYNDVLRMKNAGINLPIVNAQTNNQSYAEDVLRLLDWCEEMEMALIAFDKRCETYTAEQMVSAYSTGVLAEIANHPALGGFHIKDEASATAFPTIRAWADVMEAAVPNKLSYGNLLPCYASAEQLGTSTYEAHVQAYIRDFKPQFVSYDYYPITAAMGQGSWAQYYYNMEIIRKLSFEAGLPFWTFIQSGGFNTHHIDPTVAQVKWQVNTGLAFGAKGFQHFCYWTPPTSGWGSYETGFVSQTGVPFTKFEGLAAINNFALRIDEYLMTSINKGVIQVGSSTNFPIGTYDPSVLLSSYGALTSVTGGNYVVGCFDYKGTGTSKNMYYVVDNTPTGSANTTATLNFNGSKNVTIIKDGQADRTTTASSVSFSLSTGEGVLVIIN